LSEPVRLPTRPDEKTVLDCLTRGTLEVDARVLPASNATFVGEISGSGRTMRCVYKPVRGERPLWDFPTGTLAAREVAAYEVSRQAGWNVVPATVLGDGPFGPGMVQEWVETGHTELVGLVPEGQVPRGWRHVLDAWDADERPVSLVHADDPALRRMTVFDAVVNNADRKAGHVLAADQAGTVAPAAGSTVRGCDHGLTFHSDDKLRTVLWGWAGDPLVDADLQPVRSLLVALDGGGELRALLERLLSGRELSRLRFRAQLLLQRRHFPLPPEGWRAVPWPIF
jgi:uncharacterized repeat protein (TIGR03843 family)